MFGPGLPIPMPLQLPVQRRRFSGVRRLLPALSALLVASCQEVPTEALRLLTIEIEAPSSSIEVGEMLEFSVSAATPAGTRLELVGLNWTSSDPTIAEVADGRVSGLLPGRTYVHAFIAGMSDSLLVTVRSDSGNGSQAVTRAPRGCWEARGAPLGPGTMC
jgi:hypothetical protein